ncbi:MAG TPA: glycoside hydrolase family 3 N-terminal domain-containing protein [Anaerolineales bacterium]|nr:glycoside hydrolase family 3 N-terminal domain-containing protein [Anaerolineales bacterium]
MDRTRTIGQKLLFAFHGIDHLPPEIIQSFKNYHPGGVTLFRSLNMGKQEQVRELTASLQRLARELDLPSLMIATDQEGGQLMAFGDGTPLPGNMALGATRSPELARKAGEVLGCELAALGINVNYAPCADVNINPQNPVVGVRSFGEDPHLVGELSAAMIEGIQSQGVAATVKHFPGHGDTASDSHHGLGIVPHSRERLHAVELHPFRLALRADVKLVMTAHLGISSIDGPDAPPATLSSRVINGLLRRDLGFDGVVVTDAMDMRAIRQGELLREDVLRAAQAGVDLLLMTSNPQDHARAYESLLQGAYNGQLTKADLQTSADRISRLKHWLTENATSPDLSVIQCGEHMQVANEIAERSITLVRDEKKYLPVHLTSDHRIAVIVPTPQDLTPADTSSYIQPKLAESIRAYHTRTDEFNIPYAPSEQETVSVLAQVRQYDLIVIGTINAYTEEKQAEFVRQLLQIDKPVLIVAMRLPYDLAAFPQASTYVCTYGILEPSMRAVAKAIFGLQEMTGHLPVSIPGMVWMR